MMKEKLKENKIIYENEIDTIIDEKISKLIENVKKDYESSTKAKNDIHALNKPKHLEHEPLHPVPPHRIYENLNLDNNLENLINVFGDEYTAIAVIKALKESPIEIQIIAKIVINIHDRINEIYGR